MTTVEDILYKKGPHFNKLECSTHVIDALTIMKAENLSYTIVTKKGEYEGIFTERDYAQKVILMGRASGTTTIDEIMSRHLPCVSYNDTIEDCLYLMNAHSTHYLPVFEDFEFKGVITMNDLIGESIDKKERTNT